MTEKDIIQSLTLGQRTAPAIHGVGDDAALLVDNRVVTCDTMIETVHWDDKLSPEDIGWKIVAINASDTGAMGGLPDWCTLSLSLSASRSESWVGDFAKGMRAALKRWNIRLIGGDTTRSPNHTMVSMTMSSRRGYHWAWQSDAKVGDDIWVTGTLGDAAAGFFEPDKHPYNTALQRPEPPIELVHALVHNQIIHALTDISDGLHHEISRICERSKVGAKINPKALPSSSVLYRNPKSLAYQTAFGEDYEYLFTAPKRSEQTIRSMAARNKTTVHKIGSILEDSTIVKLEGASWPEALFTHFESKS